MWQRLHDAAFIAIKNRTQQHMRLKVLAHFSFVWVRENIRRRVKSEEYYA